MPDHAEIFAYCRSPRARSPGNRSSPPRTNTLIEIIQARQAHGQVQAPPAFHHQQPQEEARVQAQARVQPQQYQAYGPVQPMGMVQVREREVGDDSSSDASSPPSPTTGSTIVAFLDGSNNHTATVTRSNSTDPEDDRSAPLDAHLDNTIHPKGNLVLLVGRDTPSRRQRHILVQAETIEHFGPLWLAVVKASAREKLFASRRTAHLPDDDADMMLVLMYLSHAWHVGKVPRELSFRQLLAMARLCAKYDMNLQVAPFVRRWIVPHQEKLLVPGREQWLFVAHQFGLERHYVTLANHLVLHCRTDKQRELVAPGRCEKLEGYVPEEALVEIRRKRMKALAAFLNVVYTLVDGLENGNTCRATLPTSPDENAEAVLEAERAMCTHCNHGELIRYLKIHGFWPPIVQSSIITSTVVEVFDKLTSIPAISYRHMRTTYTHTPDAAPAESSGNAHAICDAGKQLAAMLADERNKLEMPIAESTTAAIRENADKVGLREEAEGPCFLLPEGPLDGVSAAAWGQGTME